MSMRMHEKKTLFHEDVQQTLSQRNYTKLLLNCVNLSDIVTNLPIAKTSWNLHRKQKKLTQKR